MKFEKLNDNKIRITLSIQDLAEKEIDFHVFMSDPIESQNILIDMLEEAKKQTGFDPEDYNLKVEALAMADTNFVFTITKVLPDIEKPKLARKKFTVKRKSFSPSCSDVIYCFNTFDDYCGFLCFLSENKIHDFINDIADSVCLYFYKNEYYLVLSGVHLEVINKLKFFIEIVEFSKNVTNSKPFASKLKESGSLIMDNNALEIGLKHFV